MFVHLWWQIQHAIGADNASGPAYLIWSGFIGDITILTGLFYFIYKHTCHHEHCFRPAKHMINGGEFYVCKRHHPTLKGESVTMEHINKSHKGAQR